MDFRRRSTLALLLASCVAAARAQPVARIRRLAWLTSAAIIPSEVYTEFVAGMRELGWTEGTHYTVENLRYEGDGERLRAIAAEAVGRNFDVIVCAGTIPAVAARRVTTTIPIVFYLVGDPVGAGLVASPAYPGGNATGLGGLGPGIYAKMLELLLEVAPKAKRIAMLTNPGMSLHAGFAADAEAAARAMKVTLAPIELRAPDELDAVFAAVIRQRADALLILGQPFLIGQGPRVARFAIEQRLPTMVPFDGVVRDGLLMAYGAKLIDDVRRVPYYVDRILKGASPASLPVEQPTRFYLTINVKTAKAIGLTLPPSLLQRADQLVE